MILLTLHVSDVNLQLAGPTPEFPENEAVLHIYTSGDLGPMKTDTGVDLEQGLIIGEPLDDKAMTFHLPNAKVITGSSCMVVTLFAKSTEGGRPYLADCGSCMLNLEELKTKGAPFDQRLDFVNPHNSHHISKGSLTLQIQKAIWDVEPAIKTDPWMAIPGPQRDKWIDRMNNYIMRIMNMYYTPQDEGLYAFARSKNGGGKFAPSNPALRRIHCPYFQMDFGGMMLPGSAYASVMPRMDPSEAYFAKLIDHALDLYEMDKGLFLATIEIQLRSEKIDPNFASVLDVIGGACGMYAQGNLYVGDHSNAYNPSLGTPFEPKKSIIMDDDWGNLRVTHGNDCEEMGQDGLITARTLKGFYSKDWRDPTLKAIKQVLKHFLLFLPQGAVATPAAKDSQQKDGDFIGHIFCMMIPHGRVLKMLERTHSDPKHIGLSKDVPAWSYDADIVFVEGTGRVSPILKPGWEWKNKSEEWFQTVGQAQNEFESMNTSFSSAALIQLPWVAHPKNKMEFDSFYRFIVGGFIPQEPGVTATDITFIYSDEKTYGVLVHDLVYDINNPGIVYNELRTEEESLFINDCLNMVHPVPQLVPRSKGLVEQDISFLERDLGLVRCTDQEKKHLGYFFSIEELRSNKSLVKFRGPYEARYKYFGLDDFTAYIELCLFAK